MKLFLGKLFCIAYWRSLSSHSRPFQYLLLRVINWSRLGPFINFDAGGFRLYLFPSSISAGMWLEPHKRVYDMLPCLQPGNIIVDVGANIGTTVIPAASRVGLGGRVYAFEAHPVTFRYLNRNISLNKLRNVSTFNIAAGDEEGMMPISDCDEDDCNRIMAGDNGMKTRVARLDKILKELDKINLLKIDVEGYELFVLRGATETLKKTDCINIEMSENNFSKYGYTCRDVLDLIGKSGFKKFFKISNDTRFVEFSPGHATFPWYENIIATKDISYLTPLISC